MYWLPKLHKRPYKARFIANSSSCTTTELSKLLTSCLTAVKNHVIRYCEKVYERSGKKMFWSIKSSGEVLNKLLIKSRGFHATSLSTYDFSTLYTRATENRFFPGPDRFLVCKTDSVCIKHIFFGPKKHTLRIIYWPNYMYLD